MPLSTATRIWAAATLAIAGAIGAGMFYQRQAACGEAGCSQKIASTGAALVGGPFALTNHRGERVSHETYRGRYLLVSFGYTYCPDVCPSGLQVMSAALDILGAKAAKVQPLFITIDPERDGVQEMAAYVANFREGLVGLTGTPDEIAAVAKAYRVYHARVEPTGPNAPYLMDHSSIFYLMGPDGRFLTHFAYGTGAADMAKGIAQHLDGDA